MADVERLVQLAAGLGTPGHQRPIFLCCDQTKPKWCDLAVGLESWDYLKLRLAELGLLDRINRTKGQLFANLRAGADRGGLSGRCGWYHSATPAVLARMIQEHLIGGQPVAEYTLGTFLPESRSSV